MESGSFYGAGPSFVAPSGYPSNAVPVRQPDGSLAIHQKLDSMMSLFADHKRLLVESKAETADLKSKLDALGSEVVELKKKVEAAPTTATTPKRKRVPRELSVKGYLMMCVAATSGGLHLCRMQSKLYMMAHKKQISLRVLKGIHIITLHKLL